MLILCITVKWYQVLAGVDSWVLQKTLTFLLQCDRCDAILLWRCLSVSNECDLTEVRKGRK